MLIIVWRLSLRSVIVLLILMATLRGLAYNESYSQRLRAFLNTPPDCPQPCFLGIYPGLTPSDMLDILKHNPWVAELDTRRSSLGIATISWNWSGQQPTFIDASETGGIELASNRLDYVFVHTAFSFGDLWLALGAPQKGIAAQYHLADYPAHYFSLRTLASCRNFWRSRGTLIIKDQFMPTDYDLPQVRRQVCQRG
ncbi:MAG: hypothetical protein K8L99_12710 [Anaerolineae bacterium]|nr:hypothetical protein [Anaerolineae bacterium]